MYTFPAIAALAIDCNRCVCVAAVDPANTLRANGTQSAHRKHTHSIQRKHWTQRAHRTQRAARSTQHTGHSTRQARQRPTADESGSSLTLQISTGNLGLVGLRWYSRGSLPLQSSLGNPRLVVMRWYTGGPLPLRISIGDLRLVGLRWVTGGSNPKVLG